MPRTQDILQDNGLVRFYLGPKMVYLVAGLQGIRGMFVRDWTQNTPRA